MHMRQNGLKALILLHLFIGRKEKVYAVAAAGKIKERRTKQKL